MQTETISELEKCFEYGNMGLIETAEFRLRNAKPHMENGVFKSVSINVLIEYDEKISR